MRWGAWAGAIAAALAASALVRAVAPSLPSTIPNWTSTSPLVLAVQAVAYAGGGVLYGLRAYAAFGPALLYAGGALVGRPLRDRRAALALVGLAAGLTFLATDTLRVMAVASVVVLPLAAAFVAGLAEAGRPGWAWFALGLQAAFSVVVYGHLRTFEASPALQGIAAVLSLAALAVVGLACARPGWAPRPTAGAA